MSYALAFLGFVALIVLHEAGHFVAAKAVGMRVERFSLFFGPMPIKWRRGETEYGVGVLPLGGYVKITGMNPNEELPLRGSAARLLQPEAVEADRRDPRRTGGEPPDRVPDRVGHRPVGGAHGDPQWAARRQQDGRRRIARAARRPIPEAGRPHRRGRWQAHPRRRSDLQADLESPLRRHAGSPGAPPPRRSRSRCSGTGAS